MTHNCLQTYNCNTRVLDHILKVWQVKIKYSNSNSNINQLSWKTIQQNPLKHVSTHTNTHTGQSVHISLVYFCLPAGYFRPLQLLSNQTANQEGRGGSHRQQTACPLSFFSIPTSSSLSLSPSSFLGSMFLYLPPLLVYFCTSLWICCSHHLLIETATGTNTGLSFIWI